MNKIKIVCVLAFAAFAVGVFFTNNSLVPTVESNSGGPSTGRTGAPGETTCTACHTQNAGNGLFSITAPANYVPGQAYLIQVQHSTADATRLRWGFELTALDDTNLAAGQFSNSSSLTQTKSGLVTGNTRYYVEHTSTGTFAGTSGGATWTFNWVAPPTDVGPVTFYAAGNQADNDGTKLGDQIYTATTVSRSADNACTGDTWSPTSSATPPSGRYYHTAVWTGTEMIVWGGSDSLGVSNTGARYNPSTNTWTTVSTTNAPAARTYHTAVWTGTEMIVWGGNNGGDLNTGGKYNPTTDTWTAMSTTNAPSARQFPQAVWTGTEMVVWGGGNGGGQFDTGARYNPTTDTWATMTSTNAPSARFLHTAVWTGSQMIVWGGFNSSLGVLNTGGKYNPVTDIWTATNSTSNPTGHTNHTAVWTGTEMITWGGSEGGASQGWKYNPAADSWTPISTTNVPGGRHEHTAIWTGSEMIVWGGLVGTSYLNDGGRYDPVHDTWTATTTTSAPVGRYHHTAVWTGREMVVWGGYDGSNYLDTGGEYCETLPPTPTPTSTYTPTNTTTPTATKTPTNTATNTPTSTATATPANSASSTPTNTATVTATNTAIPTPTQVDCTMTMYGSDTSGNYFTVNINTGAASLVGTLPTGGTTEIEYDPISQRAFAQAGAFQNFGNEFDVNTGAAIGGNISDGHTFTGLEWVGSTLYGTSIDTTSGPSTLRTLDPWTGASTLIGATGVSQITGLAYDQGSGTMYGVTGPSGTNPMSLVTINLGTGAATLVGSMGITTGSLELAANGNLYAGGGQGNAGNLYQINASTGASTLVGSTGFGTISGLINVCSQASTPTNTPTSTSTSTSTNTPTNTPTDTPTPSGTPSISGTIIYGNPFVAGATPTPRPVKNVTLQSTSGSPAVGPVVTTTTGTYTLTGFGSGAYTIRPTKPSGPNTAITSADAARTAQGVAGTNPFVSQNMRFAADTTGNGGANPVSSQDAAFIAKFTVGLTGFGRTGTWFFFVTGAPSPMPTPPPGTPTPTPDVYNDSRSYASVSTAITGENYIAILVGEVSGNYNTNTNPRPAMGLEKPVSVELPQIVTENGKEIVIPVRVQGAADKDITSYEFDLRYDASVIQPVFDPVDVAKTASRGLSFAVNPYEPGRLRVAVYGAYPIDSDGVLLNLKFAVVGKPGSVSPLSFERIMFNEGEPEVITAGGNVELF